LGYHDIQQVCLNGHQTTARYNQSPEHRKKFCAICGESTIHKCPECDTSIKGKYNVDGVISVTPTAVPTHCENCGNQFPWTKRKAEVKNQIAPETTIDYFQLLEKICSRFHLVARQLRTRYNDRETLAIDDEYDTQDLLHALLHVHFDDIRPEEWSPSYAGGGSRVDFLLKEEKIIIEVKKTRSSLKEKHIGEQLIIDSTKYRAHPDCKKLFCFVYDPEGWVANPKGLENDLNKKEKDFEVKVLIVPKGH